MNPILSAMSHVSAAFIYILLLLWFAGCAYVAYLWWPQ